MKRKIIVSLMLAFCFATTFSISLGYTISYYINLKSVSDEILINGSILPDEEVDLSFETSGKIVEINFKEESPSPQVFS